MLMLEILTDVLVYCIYEGQWLSDWASYRVIIMVNGLDFDEYFIKVENSELA